MLKEHKVSINIDGVPQNTQSLMENAENNGSGYAGDYLARAIFDEIDLLYGSPKGCEPEEISKEQLEHLIGEGLSDLIDIAVGRMIRDIATHAEGLKMQISTAPASKSKLRKNQIKHIMLAKKLALDLASKNRGNNNVSKEKKLLDEIFSYNKDEALIEDLGDAINEWGVEDGIQGVYDDSLDVYSI